nr:unnamed protein product [Haemonchus contortus]
MLSSISLQLPNWIVEDFRLQTHGICSHSDRRSTSFDAPVVRRSEQGSEVDAVLKEIGPFRNRGSFAGAIVIHDHNGPRRVRREIFSVAIATIQPESRRPPILSIGDPIGDRG